MQRLFDILFSSVALLLLGFPLLAIMLVLKFTGEGEIFYVQKRVGKDGKLFGVIKFATMLKDSPNLGTGTVTVKNDPRILPVGRFLRRTKLNELPQLINIFNGSMSVIGPRPQSQRCFDAFPDELKPVITGVKPGLSGVGSIVFRDEEEMLQDATDADRFYDEVIMPYKGRLEQWYASHRNLGTYFGCIWLTAWTVVTGRAGALYKLFPSAPKPPPPLERYIVGNNVGGRLAERGA